jgi:hypothetical protein
MSHLDICSTSYDEKKGRESNWQFDFRPLKVGNWPDPGGCKWSATHCWKSLNEGYKFALDLITIRGLQRKLCTLKVKGIPIVGISGLPLGSLGTKSHLDVAPMENCRVYYMGEGGGFPRVQAVVSLVNPKSLVARPNTKGAPESELTTLWLLECRFERVIENLVTFLNPIPEHYHARWPFLVLGACPELQIISLFDPLKLILSLTKNLGLRHVETPKISERDCKGQNSSTWRVLYIIVKLLKCRCLKWACITHFNI